MKKGANPAKFAPAKSLFTLFLPQVYIVPKFQMAEMAFLFMLQRFRDIAVGFQVDPHIGKVIVQKLFLFLGSKPLIYRIIYPVMKSRAAGLLFTVYRRRLGLSLRGLLESIIYIRV